MNFDLRRMNAAPKQSITMNLDKDKICKVRNKRSPELLNLLENKFTDKKAMTDRKSDAKELMLTTPFIRAGFIDKSKLNSDTNNIFDVLGVEQALKGFKFKG